MNNISLNGVPEDFASAVALANKNDDRVRKEFEKWMVLTYSNNKAIINQKKGGDGGIDGIAYMIVGYEANKPITKQILFSVKSNQNLSPAVIRELYGTIERDNAAMGVLLTLYPMPNLVKEAKKYGTFQNEMFSHVYSKIEVISVQEILDGTIINIPTSIEVLKDAELKKNNNQQKLF